MPRYLLNSLIILLLSNFSYGQHMTNDRLEEVMTEVVDSINGYTGYWEITHRGKQLLCVTDETHNRMRIISPIIHAENLDKELLLDLLTANFHSALDVKYALSKGIVWSVYIHPLKELSENEVVSALEQVVNASANFGTTFSSTEMVFAGGQAGNSSEETKEKPKPVVPAQKL